MAATKVPFTIKHIATGLSVDLGTLYLTDFQDNLDTKYNTENVFGRMDPITTYQGTTRKITVGVAFRNMRNTRAVDGAHRVISRIMRMQYPVYKNAQNALSLAAPPLVEVKFGNYIRSGTDGPLLCAMNGFGYTPTIGFKALDSPYVTVGKSSGGGDSGLSSGHIAPPNITLKFDFTVLHEHPMGFGEQECAALDDPFFPKEGGKYPFYGGSSFGPHQPMTRKSFVAPQSDDPPNAQQQANLNCIFKP